jgi:hypothetical protein
MTIKKHLQGSFLHTRSESIELIDKNIPLLVSLGHFNVLEEETKENVQEVKKPTKKKSKNDSSEETITE